MSKKRTILILAANPKNTPPLRLDQEVREIANGLERAQKRGDFILKQKWAARPIDVRRAMLDHKPNIVHFCGHGTGEEGLAFEDDKGETKLVGTDALEGFFELFAGDVECIVLNACYSEIQAKAIGKHIPCVIGMKKAIGDAAAIEFAVAFYDALGAGKSVEFAYKLACNAIRWAGIPEHLTPALKFNLHLPDKETSPPGASVTLPPGEKPAALNAAEAHHEQQRKNVTVLFADVSGFTAMSETMDAEEVSDTINALWAKLDAIIVAHGGTIDKHIGDSLCVTMNETS